MKTSITLVIACLILSSCNYTITQNRPQPDTLIIKSDIAVFYYPDSFALEKLKTEVGKETFDSAVVDYTHFMNKASTYIDFVKLSKTTFTGPKVLRFICHDKTEHIINTNDLVEFWGVILFKHFYKPKLIDITIVDLEYQKYFY